MLFLNDFELEKQIFSKILIYFKISSVLRLNYHPVYIENLCSYYNKNILTWNTSI